EKRKEQRTSAIAKVLHRKIRAAVDPTTADIAVAVYDLDEIAVRLADGADYDGLTALIAADLAPARLAAMTGSTPPPPAVAAPPPAVAPEPDLLPIIDTQEQQALPGPRLSYEEAERRAAREAVARATEAAAEPELGPVVASSPLGGLRADLEGILPAAPAPRRPRSRTAPVTHEAADVLEIAEEPTLTPPTVVREGSLRNQVYQVLHDSVPANDRRDVVALTTMVGDLLDLDDVERLTASNYVRTWKSEVDAGRRTAVNGRHLQGILPTK
ncbi:hypothetical protein AB0B76_15215, partial [Dactylosporangium sp. NPDC049140]